MKTIATLAAAALVTAGALGAPQAEARGRGGALVAGLVGGLAAGALIGAAVSEAQAAPAYGHARPEPYGYGYAAAPVVRGEVYEDAPVYRTERVVRTYEAVPDGYGYRPAGYRWRRHCDRPHGYREW
ncbi:hypothetical protein J2X36_003506 [Methylobacterium sp. BE186]|uniref:hypothetical protein n=1 Tax=Methylobacterium sp. BE186 TaxID=2817715 RepID=UPI0028585921|nr:hypothetical protein [Methylobacterium sp. BE186]MDR7038735.1 hypothetical protein [Methylobacterium sp. BE186]